MAEKSKIEWTEATWNPWHGCHKVSAGCKNCYMFREKKHYGQDPNVVVRSKTTFYDPLKWKESRRIFTCSWSDFFIEEADAWRDEAFAIMALTPQHTYQVLTKRPERMLEYVKSAKWKNLLKWMNSVPEGRGNNLCSLAHQKLKNTKWEFYNVKRWPLTNVWLGVSVEDQKTADERIPLLLQTPAAIRWLSIEPLLGPIDLERELGAYLPGNDSPLRSSWLRKLHWVVAGGESGPDARPMHPAWVQSIRDQCINAGVPFFMKQWGEWWPISQTPDFWIDQHPRYAKRSMVLQIDGTDQGLYFPKGAMTCFKVGKSVSGRLLDGREWNEMPEVNHAA